MLTTVPLHSHTHNLSLYHLICLLGGNAIFDIGEWFSAHEAKRTNSFFCIYRWPDALICELMHPQYPVEAGGVGREKSKGSCQSWHPAPALEYVGPP